MMVSETAFAPVTVVGTGDGESWEACAAHVRHRNFRIVEQFYEIDETGNGARAIVQLFDPCRELYVAESADDIARLIEGARS